MAQGSAQNATQNAEDEHQPARNPDNAPPEFDRVGNIGNPSRPWQITREVFQQFGATPSCPKCTDWMRGVRSTRNHSAACRTRLESALKMHPIYGPRIVQSERRRNTEEHEQAPAQVPDAVPTPVAEDLAMVAPVEQDEAPCDLLM